MTKNFGRREFLRRSAITAVGLGLSSPLLEGLAGARPQAGTKDKVVIALNLFGGNDFLNTVIPVDQYGRYRDLRPTLGLGLDNVVALPGTNDLALNPGMTAMRDLYAQNKVAIVTGVGAPPDTEGLFDHERSQALYQMGVLGNSALVTGRTGWLGRFLDTVPEGLVTPGVDMGGGGIVLDGIDTDAISINSIGELEISISYDFRARRTAYERMMAIPHHESSVGEYNRQVRQKALEQADLIRERTGAYTPAVAYPEDNSLANTLQQAAALVWADIGVRSIGVGFDGYDTHAGQNDGAEPGNLGYHDYLMMSVSQAVAAFQADLEAQGVADRVMIVIYSEFGRRPEQNADNGTDHGYASGMFVVGQTVRGGIYGQYPSLEAADLVLDGNLDISVDFRSVYATVLANFLDTNPVPILGGSFPLLGFVA